MKMIWRKFLFCHWSATLALLITAGGLAATAFGQNATNEIEQEKSSFVATGFYRVFEGVAFPAILNYDAKEKWVWIDIQATAESKSWAIFDWSLPSPAGYIGNDQQCFSMTLAKDGFSPAAFKSNFDLNSKPDINLYEMPEGLHANADIIIIIDDESIVIFDADSIEFIQPAPIPHFDASSCQPIKESTDRFSLNNTSAAVQSTKAPSPPTGLELKAEMAKPEPYLIRNLRYEFKGPYSTMKYQGSENKQSKKQYDAAMQKCKEHGPDKCKPTTTRPLEYDDDKKLIRWFDRYGYHCGDGWPTGRSDDVLSPLDYCCKLHDNWEWEPNRVDWVRNLCGFAACITCKSYSPGDLKTVFKADYDASVKIALPLSAGLTATICYPMNFLTGFQCIP